MNGMLTHSVNRAISGWELRRFADAGLLRLVRIGDVCDDDRHALLERFVASLLRQASTQRAQLLLVASGQRPAPGLRGDDANFDLWIEARTCFLSFSSCCCFAMYCATRRPVKPTKQKSRSDVRSELSRRQNDVTTAKLPGPPKSPHFTSAQPQRRLIRHLARDAQISKLRP